MLILKRIDQEKEVSQAIEDAKKEVCKSPVDKETIKGVKNFCFIVLEKGTEKGIVIASLHNGKVCMSIKLSPELQQRTSEITKLIKTAVDIIKSL